jgi:hypothetical protein
VSNSTKVLDENIEVNLGELGLDNSFLHMATKLKQLKK